MLIEKEQGLEAVISRFSSAILHAHFGKGPKSIYVNINIPFICIQIRDFLSPMEKTLLSKSGSKKVLELRELMMDEIKEQFKESFLEQANFHVQELYVDWNLEKKSGMILAVLKEEDVKKDYFPNKVDEKAILDEVIKISEIVQKKPGSTELFWLSERTILIKRTGIFTLLERELIQMGFAETLKLAKGPLEYKFFKQSNLEKILKRPIDEIFVDWSFNEDKGYAVLVLQKK